MTRVFNYSNSNEKDSIGYTTVRATATSKPSGQLFISINMPFSKGKDYVEFTIDGTKLKPGYVGSYKLQPAQPGGVNGDVQAVYGYRRDQYSYTEVGPGTEEGSFNITSYDAQKKMIAGTYRFSIHSFHDPKLGLNWHKTDISIAGEFNKVLLP